MPAQVRYDQAILAGEFVKAESPINAGAGVAMQQEQWLALTCINVVHLHVRKGHGLPWRERCSHGVVLFSKDSTWLGVTHIMFPITRYAIVYKQNCLLAQEIEQNHPHLENNKPPEREEYTTWIY